MAINTLDRLVVLNRELSVYVYMAYIAFDSGTEQLPVLWAVCESLLLTREISIPQHLSVFIKFIMHRSIQTVNIFCFVYIFFKWEINVLWMATLCMKEFKKINLWFVDSSFPRIQILEWRFETKQKGCCIGKTWIKWLSSLLFLIDLTKTERLEEYGVLIFFKLK